MMNFFRLFLFFLIISITSCKTDVDINAPYKDVSIVYGILDPNDSIHYIKINKSFAGQADVKDMAKVRDSSEYNPKDLVVEIMEIGGLNRKFTLKDTLIGNKELGYFYGPESILYYFKTTQPLNNSGGVSYSLKIRNNSLNKEISATTKLVKPFIIESPGPTAEKKISFADDKGLLNFPTKVKWKSATYARRYDIKMVFNYFEITSNGDTIVPKPIEWISKGIKSSSPNGNESMEAEFTGLEFYSKIMNEIPDDAQVKRLAYSLDFYIYAAGEDLSTYIEVTEPSKGLVQDKPEYSNLKNAFGIFSSRSNQKVLNKGLSAGTARFLKVSDYTRSKNFVKYYNFAGTTQYFEILSN